MSQSEMEVPRPVVTHQPELQGLVLRPSQPEMVVAYSETANLVLSSITATDFRIGGMVRLTNEHHPERRIS
jgi:hypothetical protein